MEIAIRIPYPPSVNETYYNRKSLSKDGNSEFGKRTSWGPIPLPNNKNLAWEGETTFLKGLEWKTDNKRGRGLTKEARNYRKMVANLIRYSFLSTNFGKEKVKLTILDCQVKARGDNHNCIKIVADAIELSGIIKNDKQIVASEIIPYHTSPKNEWIIKLELYDHETNHESLKRFLTKTKEIK